MSEDLIYALAVRRHVIAQEFQLIASSIHQSHGKDEMSSQDIKLAILGLQGLCQNQQELIEAIVYELGKPKTPWYKRILK